MQISRINLDMDNCQWLLPSIDNEEWLDYLTFNCSSRLKEWGEKPVRWAVDNPKDQRGNFYTIGTGNVLVFDQEVYNSSL